MGHPLETLSPRRPSALHHESCQKFAASISQSIIVTLSASKNNILRRRSVGSHGFAARVCAGATQLLSFSAGPQGEGVLRRVDQLWPEHHMYFRDCLISAMISALYRVQLP